VTLPSLDPKRTSPLIDAPTFIALTAGGEASVGKLSPGLRASGGTVVSILQVSEKLTALLGGDAPTETRRSAHARRATAADRADTLVLVDARARSNNLIALLEQASPRAIAVAARGDRPARLPYLWTPATSQAAPIHIAVNAHGLTLYGAAVAWGDIEGELQKLVESQRKATSMDLLAALTVEQDVEVQALTTVLGALAAAGFDEVELTFDITSPERPVASLGSRDGGVPTVSIGQPSASGDLDKAIIRRYMKRNIQKIQYCYEKQLLQMPSLQGTVSTTFTITAAGGVREAKGTGVHPAVAACVASVISNIEFPKPKDGGLVRVAYPFTFRPGGG
jgi:biopolymer transport protein ExbD